MMPQLWVDTSGKVCCGTLAVLPKPQYRGPGSSAMPRATMMTAMRADAMTKTTTTGAQAVQPQ